ncbi:MAG: dephospho-CoA kinase [Spirochaetia bacterium]|jgi:dephospho-CoA kinase
MVVGLTGRYCSGKGTAARAFASHGFRIVDADDLSHEVLAERAAQVIQEFGPGARAPDGGVDRRAVGRIVFADPAARTRLEAILYPDITERIRQYVAEDDRDVVINAPLLQRAGLQSMCDALVFVTAPALVRLVRAMRRDKLSLRDAWARINAQKDVRPQLNDRVVDTYTVRNRGSLRSLQRRVERIAAVLRG